MEQNKDKIIMFTLNDLAAITHTMVISEIRKSMLSLNPEPQAMADNIYRILVNSITVVAPHLINEINKK